MLVCTYLCVCANRNMYVHIPMHSTIFLKKGAFRQIYMYTLHKHIGEYIIVCTNVHVHKYLHINNIHIAHINIYIHLRTYAYMHMHAYSY